MSLDLPVNSGGFQERNINIPHCDCYFQFQYCEDLNSLRPITPPNGLGINHVRINGFRISCGCLIELVPCGLQPTRVQQLPALGSAEIQASDLDPNVSWQAQGVTLPGNPDAHQHEVAGPSENAQIFMNGHLDTGDLEASWNHQDNADYYPLTSSQQPEEGQVLSNMATRDQQQQRRQTEMVRAVFPNDPHAPEERSMPPTDMQYPPTLQGAQAGASIIHGAAAPESSTPDQQAARTLLMILHSGNVDDTHLGDPTGTLSNPIDINNFRSFEEAMEDQPALSTQDLYAATPVTAQHPTNSNAAGHVCRRRPNDKPQAAAPIFPQEKTSTPLLGSQLRAPRRRSSSRSWGSVSRPMSAASNASNAGVTIRCPVKNLRNTNVLERTRHADSSSDTFEVSLKENHASRPGYYRRKPVPGDNSYLMSPLKGGGSGSMPNSKSGNQTTIDVCVPYLPSQPMERDPPHQRKRHSGHANRDTLKAFSYFAILAVVMALVAGGLFR